MLNILNGKEPGLIWCIGNCSRIGILSQMTKKYDTKYTLIGDEFDTLVPYNLENTVRKMDEDYLKIHNNSLMVVGTTATTVKVWLNKNINFKAVKILPIPKEYIAFRDCTFEELIFNCYAINTIENNKENKNNEENMINVCSFLKNFIEKPSYTNLTSRITFETGLDHPLHILVYVSRNMIIHKHIFNFLRCITDTKKYYTVITANSDNGGFKVYDTLCSTYKNISVPIHGSSKHEVSCRLENYFHLTKPTYGDIISFLNDFYKNVGKKICNIICIGGDIFKRGMAFTSNDYMITPTDMFYLPPKGVCIDTMIQALGRLSGCYPHFYDQIKRVIHTTSNTIKIARLGIEETNILNNYGTDNNKYSNLNNYMKSGDIILPGVLKKTKKNFIAKGMPTKLDKKMYTMDARKEVNIEALFQDCNITKIHDKMYFDSDIPGYKYRKSSCKLRQEYLEKNDIQIQSHNVKFDDEKTYTENLRCAIKNYIEINPSNNKYMNVSEWLKITGLCGFKNKTTYHYTLMTYLVKNKFMERSNNKLQMLVL